MDWIKETAFKLRNLESTERAIDHMKTEIQRLTLSERSIRSSLSDGTPVKSGGNTREEMLVNTISEIGELKERIKLETQWVTMVREALKDIQSEDRQILEIAYIQNRKYPIEEICEYLNIERTRAYERRSIALERFARRLYGAL